MPSPLEPSATYSVLAPSTPLAYLPPSLGFELTIVSYVLVAALVVQLWDMLNNVNADYELLVRHRLGLPSIVYCISRLSTLAYLLVATIYETAPIGNCAELWKLPPLLGCIAMPSTALLFFFRVRAMYHGYRYVIAFFFLMWIGIVGGNVLSLLGNAGSRIGPTQYCLSGKIKPYVWTGTIVPLLNDTLIFVAISLRLMLIGLPENIKMKDAFKVIVFGKDLSAFSKALLRDGQAYYLTTLGLTLAMTIIFFIEPIPFIYRSLLGIPNFTLMNVMACRVYRRTKSGIYRESTTVETQISLPIAFQESSRRAGYITSLQSVQPGNHQTLDIREPPLSTVTAEEHFRDPFYRKTTDL